MKQAAGPFHEIERTKLSNNCLGCINQSQCFGHMILTQTILLNMNLLIKQARRDRWGDLKIVCKGIGEKDSGI